MTKTKPLEDKNTWPKTAFNKTVADTIRALCKIPVNGEIPPKSLNPKYCL